MNEHSSAVANLTGNIEALAHLPAPPPSQAPISRKSTYHHAQIPGDNTFMSGPKVIVIVSPEQLKQMQLAERGKLVAELSTAISLWKRSLEQSGKLKSEDELVVLKRRAALEAGFEENHDLAAKSIVREIEFLNHQASQAREEYAHRIADKNKRKRSLQQIALTLLGSSTCSDQQKTALKRAMKQLEHANNDILDAVSIELNQLSSSLSKIGIKEPPSGENAKFIAQLKDGALTVGEPTSGPEQDEAAVIRDKIELLIARTEVIDASIAERYTLRLTQLLEDASDIHQRRMKVDSLIVDISRELRELKIAQQTRSTLESLLRQLEGHEESGELRGKVQAALLKSCGADEVIKLQHDVEEWMSRRGAVIAEQSKREAVLSALQSLGYDVKEGMCAAWSESGSIVVRKPDSKQYGLQVAAPSSSERMQMRVVSFATPSDSKTSARDTKAEEQWCTEFQQLTEDLRTRGFSLTLEAASAPGATPVKRIAPLFADDHEEDEEVEHDSSRRNRREITR